jgi:beta-lactamase class D
MSRYLRVKQQLRLLCQAMTLAALCACSPGKEASPGVDVADAIRTEGIDLARSALLIVRLEDGAEWLSGRVDQRFPPASTSKMPHTLIALETGYATSPEHLFAWDGVERTFDFWNRDHTLQTAYRFSAVWAYQRLTSELGHDTMSSWIRKLDYGNADTGSEDDLTTYWLRGPLEISPREQVNFLARLVREELPLSAGTYRMGRQIMQEDQGENWTLYAKTGWRSDGINMDIGWYVGWVETSNAGAPAHWLFAFNMDMPDAAEQAKRKAIVRRALASLGAISD